MVCGLDPVLSHSNNTGTSKAQSLGGCYQVDARQAAHTRHDWYAKFA